ESSDGTGRTGVPGGAPSSRTRAVDTQGGTYQLDAGTVATARAPYHRRERPGRRLRAVRAVAGRSFMPVALDVRGGRLGTGSERAMIHTQAMHMIPRWGS